MPDEKKEEEKLHPVDEYLKASGRQETAPVTFADLRSLDLHQVAPPEKKESSSSSGEATS